MGWLMFEGESDHTFVYTSEHYQKIEEETHWFSDHRRQLEMFGKAAWAKPLVALFVSGREATYFPVSDATNRWDLGRGRLQRTHFNNVYLSGEEIRAGMAEDYPVVIDANNRVLDSQTLAALERYVRQGGTYVALNVTGRHSPLHADSWPVEQLTGCKVLGPRRNMRVRVLDNNPLLKRLAGDVFQDNDSADDILVDGSFALAPDKGVQFKPLALWDDGAVAAGVRSLGKGRVVVLASTFWYRGGLRTGAPLPGGVDTASLSDLLHGLGLVSPITTNDPEVWANRFITKEGLQEWMMMLNSTSSGKQDVTLSFEWPRDPAAVYDAVSGKPVTYTWRDGIVTVPHLTVGPNDLRVIAVTRGDFQPALEHWFAIKTKYESRLSATALKAIPAPPPLPPQGMLVLEKFQFRQTTQAEPAGDTAWASEDDRKAPWRTVGEGFWDEQGYAAHGVGYYRQSFSVPPAWQGRRVILALTAFATPIFLQEAEIYCNGKHLGSYQGGGANFNTFELTRCLHSGQNELAFRVRAEQSRGGFLGQVVLFPLHDLKQQLELPQWALDRDPLNSRNVNLPIDKTPLRDVRTRIDVPADWPADRIFLRFEGATRWVSCVVVNGQPVGFNQSLHPFGQLGEVNLYPWIKPGETNTIELWPTGTIPNDQGLSRAPLESVSLSRVVLGVAGAERGAGSNAAARR